MKCNYPDWLKKMKIPEIDRNSVDVATDDKWQKVITNPETGETATLQWQAFPSGWIVVE
jgi:hypothetical protein